MQMEIESRDFYCFELIWVQIKLYGKRGIYKDSKLQEQGGKIFERDGILYNCAFSVCDQGKGLNE